MGIRLGAYGLHLPDLNGNNRLGAAPQVWPDWRLRVDIDAGINIASVKELIDDDRAVTVHYPFGVAYLDRGRAETDLRLTRSPTHESLVHPLLASTAIIAGHWAGHPSFHAGAFIFNGRVWAVLGSQQYGKSSLLGWMVRAGYGVMTDDVLVIDEGNALAGPRCLDLRDEAASYFGLGENLGTMGQRERWRVTLAPVEPIIALGGWICLKWATETQITTVPFSQRLQPLVAARGLLSKPTGDPSVWLEFAALPVLEFARPKRWAALDDAMGQLLGALAILG